jgi:hypothetical protein
MLRGKWTLLVLVVAISACLESCRCTCGCELSRYCTTCTAKDSTDASVAESNFCHDAEVTQDQITAAVESFREAYADSGYIVDCRIVAEVIERKELVACSSKNELIKSGFICDCTK